MPVDPGKTALYNSLIKDIEKVSKGKEHPVALDAASAGFKNRAFFPSFTYIGADIDFNALLTGIQKYPNDYALHVDMAKCRLGTSFADLVVSTHTIEHIQGERAKLCALKNLVETLKDKGAFILSIPVESFTEAISSFFEQKFSNISYSYHHNVKLKITSLCHGQFSTLQVGEIFLQR